MPLPDFLIAGVPKAGTTALHAALTGHPELFLPSVKEPKFFLSDGPPPRFGGPGDVQTYQEHVWRRSDYEALFDAAPAGTLRGEATPFYLYDRGAHERIAKLTPDAKLILLLRDPVDRAHSNWTHLWVAGLEEEADFLAACRAEEDRRARGWAAFWHYIALGRYGEQLQHLYQHISREQVLLLRYRDLKDDPARTLDRVCAFLGVRTGVLTAIPRENVNRHYVEDTAVNRVLRGLLRAGGEVGHRFPVPVRLAARGPLLTLLHRKKGNRPVTRPAERAALLPHFTEDIALLQDVTGERYDDWLSLDRHARAR
ncbi:putative sulfotransferase [Actinoplanes missouriensis 431]|uniref:Putative sulfotransferase n=1 Tax=Actinoplanes missouriensis (strain ATCC 14538 / DSM 43046 / CBS 188.64 / JCM 3121 / NBRC 102363 / NCIMB 12654 / NRRL B-3342 / UNCC 431) TaxID=512565 RepID=I0HAM5_ACTM4|nr:sulfotransferase [Actinoplanes missouriensis]BAL90062.1 putative sulfotransferase [Actinoplanes missouriensis 431]